MKREFGNSLLKCIADRDHFAVKGDYYPLLKSDIRKEYQPMANKILQTLAGNALLTIGGGLASGRRRSCISSPWRLRSAMQTSLINAAQVVPRLLF
eukprot:8678751-Pyramimonas_sp.AAC.1